MDDIPLCPDWWPRLLWNLHFPIKVPGVQPGPNPVNYPAGVQDLMANLHIHTLTYLMDDQVAAQKIRGTTEEKMMQNVKSLSEMHDKALVGSR